MKELEGYGPEVSIIGHVNCAVGASPLDHKTQKLLDIWNIYQCSQLIGQPSRITYTRSAIDLFLTNDPQRFSHSGVSDLWIRDHCLVYAIRKISLPESTTKIKTSGCFEKFDPVSFRNDLAMAPCYLVAAESDPNKA